MAAINSASSPFMRNELMIRNAKGEGVGERGGDREVKEEISSKCLVVQRGRRGEGGGRREEEGGRREGGRREGGGREGGRRQEAGGGGRED